MNIVVHDGPLRRWMSIWPLLRSLAARGEPLWVVAPWQLARLAERRIPGAVAVDGAQPRWQRLHAPGAIGAGDDVRDASVTPVSGDLLRALGRAERIVSFVSGGHDPWLINVRAAAPAALIACVSPRPPADWEGHVVEWMRAQLAPTGIRWPAPDDPKSDPGRPPTDRIGTDAPVVVHPGASAAAVRWPRECYAELVDVLRERGRQVRVILGPLEWQQWGDVTLRQWRSDHGAEVVTSLTRLADVLEDAALMIGNDAGPAHLAAQLGTPTLVVFGPSRPELRGPRGAHVEAVTPPRSGRIGDVVLEDVVRRVEAVLPSTALEG